MRGRSRKTKKAALCNYPGELLAQQYRHDSLASGQRQDETKSEPGESVYLLNICLARRRDYHEVGTVAVDRVDIVDTVDMMLCF